MQQAQKAVGRCHYPDCTDLSSVTCITCHQGFCMQHVHRRWGKYICEFCFLLEQARGGGLKRSRRVGYILCMLVAASGLLILILDLNNALAVLLICSGMLGVVGVGTSSRTLPRPTRARDIDTDTDMRRLFGDREDQ